MKTALYSSIRNNCDDRILSEKEIFTRANLAGYSLVIFNGFDNSDCRNRKNEMAQNRAILNEIQELFPDGCGGSLIYIIHTVPEPKAISADDDADFQLSATFK